MSLKLLEIFVNVYKEESITKAAIKLKISQPAASAAIRDLERHLNVQLFIRAGRGICKTADADRLYAYASHIISLYQEMNHAFSADRSAVPLRIGSSISIGTCLMPRCLKEYMEFFHRPMPFLKIDSSDIIEQMVLDNHLDFAFIEGVVHSEKLMAEPVLKDRLVLVCGAGHPLTSKKNVTLDDIREERFLLREKNSGTRELAQSALLLHDFDLKPAWESTSTTAIINGVIAGLGLSILPVRMLTRYLEEGSLVELRLSGILFLREYSLIYHQNKYLSPEITKTIDFFKKNLSSQ